MDDLLTTAQAAERLGVTPAYVIRFAQRCGVTPIRIGPNNRGGQWLLRAADVDELVRRRAEVPLKPGPVPHENPSPATAAQRRRRARQRGETAE